jgi:hypothetical protein
MSFNDEAVLTAAVGYVYIAPPGTPRPSPAALETLDPETFGCASSKVTASAVPTGGTFALTVGEGVAPLKQAAVTVPATDKQTAATVPATDVTAVATPDPKAKSTKTVEAAPAAAPTGTTLDLPFDSGAAEVQTALENIEGVGAGNVKVTGGGFLDDGFTIAFIKDLGEENVAVTVVSKLEPVSVTVSSDVASAPNGWTNIGHTSRDDLPEFGFDGGDTEVRGSWQNESLREVVTEPIADYLTIFLAEFDLESFELYYGRNSSKTPGVFGVSGGTQVPVETALLIIIVDGDTKLGFYAPKASVRRDDSIQLAVDEFATLPVRATFLKYGSSNVFEWVSEKLFT